MAARYEFFGHTADIGVHVYGATLAELFSNAAQAMYEVMGSFQKAEGGRRKAEVYPPKAGGKSEEGRGRTEDRRRNREERTLPAAGGTGDRRQKSVELRADSLEDLLHDWLTELLYDFATHQVLYDQLDITEATPQRVVATVTGGVVDFARSEPREEIKAVTYHQLRVEQTANGRWQATIIFDV